MNVSNGTSSQSQPYSSSPEKKIKTAGLIIIGDEILKGQVIDTNSHFMAKELYSLGVKVARISVIGDGVDEIATEVRNFSSSFDLVCTTGGIGPTHDDMTYVSVAKAFDEQVSSHPAMRQMVDKWLGHRGFEPEVLQRMAELPSNAELIFDPSLPLTSFPIVVVRNVYVFPGVPQFLEKMFPRLRGIIDGANGGEGANRFHSRVIYLNKDELSITPQITATWAKYKDSVTIGSYPVFGNLYYSTRLTMESQTPDSVTKAEEYLTGLLPPNSVIQYDNDPLTSAMEKIYKIAEDAEHPLRGVVQQTISILEEGFEKYGLSNFWICFNGGKDCTALLHLVFAVIKKKYPDSREQFQALCIQGKNPFPEMDAFIQDSAKRYNFKIRIYNGPILEGLRKALEEHPEMKAVSMGTRRSDPSGKNLAAFQMTDPSWPQVIRVSPMLDWSFNQVWTFLRSLNLPYCPLYDKGYTSIGNRDNTLPNPALEFEAADGKKSYRPAYTLPDGTAERCGRQ